MLVVADAELDVARGQAASLVKYGSTPSSSVYEWAAADRSTAHRFMGLIQRSTDDSFPHAVEMFLSARRALEFSHDQDPKRTSNVIRSPHGRAAGTPRASISLSSSLFRLRGMLIARNGLKHAYAVAPRVKE